MSESVTQSIIVRDFSTSYVVPYHQETVQQWMDLEDSAIDPVESGTTSLLVAVVSQLCCVLNSLLDYLSKSIDFLN